MADEIQGRTEAARADVVPGTLLAVPEQSLDLRSDAATRPILSAVGARLVVEKVALPLVSGESVIGRFLTAGRRYFRYWGWALGRVRDKAREHWPIFVSLLIFPLVSGGLMYLAERGGGGPIESFENAVYATWMTMATVGYGDMVPKTQFGRIMVSLDALVGLILVGLSVWLISSSLGGSSPDSSDGEVGGQDRLDE